MTLEMCFLAKLRAIGTNFRADLSLVGALISDRVPKVARVP